jgi:tRNA 2-thiouridine synthesizing protein D
LPNPGHVPGFFFLCIYHLHGFFSTAHQEYDDNMKFALIITGSPTASQACQSAVNFCRAALATGHDIYRVFLLDGAAQLAHQHCDNRALQSEWQALQKTHQLDIVTCVNSAREYHINEQDNLASGFVISGMGQLIDASANADRLITFGG